MMTNLTVSGNLSSGQGDDFEGGSGGGVYVIASSPVITSSTVASNYGPGAGGGLLVGYYSSLTMMNVIVADNSSKEGGGMSVGGYSSLTMANVTLTGNYAYDGGGGMSLGSVTSATMANVTVTRNVTSGFGGGMRLDVDSSTTLSNVTVTRNSAESGGGGIYLEYDSSPTIVSSVVAYNSGGQSGYNVYVGTASTGYAPFQHCSLYDPDAENIINATVDETNLLAEPGFLAYDADGRPTDLHLALGSALIDAGDPRMCTQDNADGCDGGGSPPDIGAYGGAYGDSWDVDGDGWYDYFWPGTIQDAPDGFDPHDYDCDDLDPSVQNCAL